MLLEQHIQQEAQFDKADTFIDHISYTGPVLIFFLLAYRSGKFKQILIPAAVKKLLFNNQH
jgi:hypothetical protein